MTSDLYNHPALYDVLLPAGAYIPYYVDLARQQGGGVLELACGTGQLTVPIAGAGLPTVGLDLSSAMLNVGGSELLPKGPPLNMYWATCAHSIWAVSLRLFLLHATRCCILCSTEDILTTFATIRRHLAPGGIFAFDIFNPSVEILARPAGQRFPPHKIEKHLSAGVATVARGGRFAPKEPLWRSGRKYVRFQRPITSVPEQGQV